MGCIAYALFQIVTGINLGWAAIGVGWLVGWSMKKGSRGLGGRRYQITGALLTYAAVAVAFIPVALHQQSEQKQGAQQTQTQSTEASDAQKAESKEPKKASGSMTFVGFLGACAMLLGIGLISPFLILQESVASGGLNLLIIFIGVRYAWMNTKQARPSVEGPFTAEAAV